MNLGSLESEFGIFWFGGRARIDLMSVFGLTSGGLVATRFRCLLFKEFDIQLDKPADMKEP